MPNLFRLLTFPVLACPFGTVCPALWAVQPLLLVAGAGAAIPLVPIQGVLRRVLMPILAMCLLAVLASFGKTPVEIHLVSYRLKVIWVYAVPNPAEMIQHEAVRDWPY